MTHGDKWFAKVLKRLEGYSKSRGWRCSAPRLIGKDQYEVWISDRMGKEAALAFDMEADHAVLVDDYGLAVDDLSAKAFETAMESANLAGKPVVVRKQLSLDLGA